MKYLIIIINQICKNMMFFIHFKDGHRETYISKYDEEEEEERDLAWEDVYMTYPEADYIEEI